MIVWGLFCPLKEGESPQCECANRFMSLQCEYYMFTQAHTHTHTVLVLVKATIAVLADKPLHPSNVTSLRPSSSLHPSRKMEHVSYGHQQSDGEVSLSLSSKKNKSSNSFFKLIFIICNHFINLHSVIISFIGSQQLKQTSKHRCCCCCCRCTACVCVCECVFAACL